MFCFNWLSKRPLETCQDRHGCLLGPCPVLSCDRQYIADTREYWIYVNNTVEWRFELMSVPLNMNASNLVVISLSNALFDGKILVILQIQ